MKKSFSFLVEKNAAYFILIFFPSLLTLYRATKRKQNRCSDKWFAEARDRKKKNAQCLLKHNDDVIVGEMYHEHLVLRNRNKNQDIQVTLVFDVNSVKKADHLLFCSRIQVMDLRRKFLVLRIFMVICAIDCPPPRRCLVDFKLNTMSQSRMGPPFSWVNLAKMQKTDILAHMVASSGTKDASVHFFTKLVACSIYEEISG